MRARSVSACVVYAMLAPGAALAQTHYTYTRIADSVSNPEVNTAGVYCVGLSNSGTVVINDSAGQVWLGDGTGSPSAVATPTFGPICPSINGLNEITHFANPATNIYTLVRNLNGSTTTLASTAAAPFLSTGRTYLASLNESGHAVFQGGEFGGDGIYVALGSDSYLPVYNPTLDSHPVITPTTASMNDNDVVVFVGHRPDPSAPSGSRTGIYRGSATALVEDGGAVITNVGVNRPVINNAGVVAFLGRDVSDRFGIFKTSDGVNFTYVGYGGFAGGHDRISINNDGKVAYDGAASPNSSIPGIFTGPDPVNDAVLRVGDQLDESTVQALFMWEEALNDSGQVAFLAQLADGRSGVYRADPNRAPVTSDGTATVLSGASTSGSLIASDPDGNALTYSIVTNGTKGTATVTDPVTGAYTYSANVGSSGSDTFTFKANDGFVDSNVATVTVSITPVPCAADVTAAVSVALGSLRLDRRTGHYLQKVTLRNTSSNAIAGPASFVLDSLTPGAAVVGAAGVTACAAPAGSSYVMVNVGADGILSSRERANVSVEFTLEFAAPGTGTITYVPRVLAGAGER